MKSTKLDSWWGEMWKLPAAIIIAMSIFQPALADNDSLPGSSTVVPDSADVCKFQHQVKVIIKKSVTLTHSSPGGRPFYNSYIPDEDISFFSSGEELRRGLIVGDEIIPFDCVLNGSELLMCGDMDGPRDRAGVDNNGNNVIMDVSIHGKGITTFKEARAHAGGYVEFMYDDPDYDPYPGIDIGTKERIVMSKITGFFSEKKYAESIPYFHYMEKISSKLPDSFYYYYIDALNNSGRRGEAKVRAQSYLQKYGSKGKYSAQVIDLMGRL